MARFLVGGAKPMQTGRVILLAALTLGSLMAVPAVAETIPIDEVVDAKPVLPPRAQDMRARLELLPEAKSKIRQNQNTDVRAYYERRDYTPIWWKGNKPTEQALALAKAIGEARYDALDPSDYPLLDLTSAVEPDDAKIVEADLALTFAAVRYTTHLAAGRVNPRSLSRHITPTPDRPDVSAILDRLSGTSNIAKSLRYFEPVHEQYWLMKNKLAELLAEDGTADIPEIPAGRALRLGSHSPRVSLLKQRIGMGFEGEADPDYFDEATLAAVKAFQRKSGLTADGVVGRGTLSVLNSGSRQTQVGLITANIERWRWMPRDLGTFHVAVNIPEFRLRVIEAGEEKHSTRVIVGKRSNPTPVFSDEIEHIIVNPYWNIPVSILVNEMMTDILIDPEGFFARNRYELLARVEGRRGMVKVHPEMVDWWTINPRSVLVRQRPGRGNALGRIKFMFPNKHAVYLHDTPTKNLFERGLRAFSHGCVRVNNPMLFADALLANDPDWSAARLKRMFGSEERRVELAQNVPVHLTYFTARIRVDGSIETFPDIYGYDSAIRSKTLL